MTRACAALAACAAAAVAACTPGPRAVSVLLVTIDTTRADHVGSYGLPRARTPALDALAAEGIRYARAYTPAPITLTAHASLLTGLYPFEHGVRDNGAFRLPEAAPTLAEALRERGYATGAFVGAFVLDRRFGLAQGFDTYDDAIPPERTSGTFGFAERQAPSVTDAALAWLARQPRARPFFLWVHYFDPHAAYEPHADDPALAALPPYDAEIAYADRELGRLLDAVTDAGRDADTLVVATSDHGEGLWEHGEISHGYFTYDSTLRVPLVVRLPDRAHAGTVVEAPVSLVDVFPTVLESVGAAAVGAGASGERLPSSEPDDAPARAIYFENRSVARAFGVSPLSGIVRGDDKWIEAPRPERYDVAADPHETQNLHVAGDATSSALRAELLRIVGDDARRLPEGETRIAVDADAAARLGALGYAPAGDAADDAAGRPDPKDVVAMHRDVLEAEARIGAGERAHAAAMLANVVRRHDFVNPRALQRLAELAPDASSREIAIDALLPYLERELDPALHFTIAAKLGVALGRAQRYAAAERAFEVALELDPENAEIRRGLATARALRPGRP